MKSDIRVTATGWVFLFFLLITFLIALNTGNGHAYILLSALMSVFLVSSLLSWRGLGRLEAEFIPPPEIYRRKPAEFLLRFREIPDFLVRNLDIKVELDEKVKSCDFFDLYADRSVRLTFLFEKRGEVMKKRVTVKSRYPFGLFERSRIFECENDVIVFPAVKRVEVFPGGSGFPGAHDFEGKEGTGGDFIGIREFRKGDNPKRIYWRGIFSSGKLLVKQFSALETGKVTVEVDSSSGENDIDTAASYVSAFIDNGYKVRLLVDGKERIGFGAGIYHKRKILRELALL